MYVGVDCLRMFASTIYSTFNLNLDYRNSLNVTFKQKSDNVFVAYQNRLMPGIYLKVKLNLAT